MVWVCVEQSREEKKIQAFMKLFDKMEQSEVAHSRAGKEVKSRLRVQSVEHVGQAAASSSSDEPRPVTDSKLSDISAQETVEIKHDGTQSSTEELVTAAAVANTGEDDSESCIIDDTSSNAVANDKPAADAELQSPCGIADSSMTATKSPTKPVIEESKVPVAMSSCVKVEVDSTDAAVCTRDQSVIAAEDMVELPELVEQLEKMPDMELTQLEADKSRVEETIGVMIEEPRLAMTSTLMQTGSGAIDAVKKTVVSLEVESGVARVGVNQQQQQSTAKLKFGMYASRRRGARSVLTTALEQNSSDSDRQEEDTSPAAKSTSESETATRPKRGRPVKFV